MSELWKYIVLSDGNGEYPVIFHKTLSHKDMAEGGLVAGISGWSKVMGRCIPVSAGFIALPELRVDEKSRSESLDVSARPKIDQELFTPLSKAKSQQEGEVK